MTTDDPDRCPKHPGPLERHERNRLNAAAHHAYRVLTPAVATLVARELAAAVDMGWRAPDGLAARVAAEVLAMPAAVPPPPARWSVKPRVTPKASA